MLRLGVALVMLLIPLASARPAGAQHLRGRLLDRESGEPIVAGVVTLVTANGVQLRAANSDESGQWDVKVPAPGTYYLSAKRIGYKPWTSARIQVALRDDLRFVFHLTRVAVTLHPVEVSARAMREYLDRTGFYDRQRSDFGHFITPDAIEKRRAARITDLLLAVPGVNLVRMTASGAGALFVQLRGSNISDGGVCRPRVFVDGILFAQGDSRPARPERNQSVELRVEDVIQRIDEGLSLDDIGHPSAIAAIEVYRSATQVPVQFGGTSVGTLCGAIVIWTRTGAKRTGQ